MSEQSRMTRDSRIEGVNALARDIAERVTGMPAYLVDDETWDAALAEAEATYVPPEPKSPLQEAINRARYPDPVASINAWNEARRRAQSNRPSQSATGGADRQVGGHRSASLVAPHRGQYRRAR